ncbi:cytochrome c-type biogenesis protein CcmE homolog, mitochondrial [Magnolia sinica]|uniref:cytochrome c-type biogenesis protein CcmE homolog, mitochondrial n=1 Tax=Magnolia sinica TaxID=86752 RepID=UPI002659CA4C|nr:cytochrome c-type biogenesis protein CcmE homolog, mitochondrial [Magnolia sinica]XP_058113544.1 cytochrome c-type biogenesis protein CcmE homolog, mitochondrial [Magnolia sinica]
MPMAFRLFSSRLRSRLHHSLAHPVSIHRPSPPIRSHLQSQPSMASPSPHLFPIPTNQSPFFSTITSLQLRALSTLRRPPIRSSRTVDIGARARQLQNRRLWTYALTFSCVAGFIIIVLSNFQDQMVFYVTPTDALEKFAANPSKNRFRLGGLVLEGSVVQPASSPEMEFIITDLITDILVRYEGSLPDLFREGHSAVVEGTIRPFDDEAGRPRDGFFSSGKAVSEKARSGICYFAATEVLAKHDEKYMPKEVAAAIERNKAKIEASESAEAASI